jgi:Pentapeptide repeats (8 copies)
MANDEHVAILKKGVTAWNAWRDENDYIHPDLTSTNLSGANLSDAYLSGANLSEGANLSGANLSRAYLREADLSGTNLSGVDIANAILVDTDLTEADLTGCRVYGVSAWNLKLERTKQRNLVITHFDEPAITVDNIEVAQFIYLLLHNEKIRDVIDTGDDRRHGVAAEPLDILRRQSTSCSNPHRGICEQ